jgi:hypothetical protein
MRIKGGSPRDWLTTHNRVHMRFRARPQESVIARQLADDLLEKPPASSTKWCAEPMAPEDQTSVW